MSTRSLIVIAVALGILLGVLGSRMLFLQWATLIPWGLVAVVVGVLARDRGQAIVDGAVYGFALGFSFMVAGYGGTDPVVAKAPFFAIIGLVSAGFGAVLSLAAQFVASRWRARSA
jgi:hypothetical protein